MAKRSFPTSEVKGSSESARLRRYRNRLEELPYVRGQGWRLRGATPRPRSGAVAESARLRQCRSSREELPPPKARGGDGEEQPHVQGVAAAWAQKGLEELLHVQGQEEQP